MFGPVNLTEVICFLSTKLSLTPAGSPSANAPIAPPENS